MDQAKRSDASTDEPRKRQCVGKIEGLKPPPYLKNEKVEFCEDSHTYHVDGEKMKISVSGLVDRAFEAFDAEAVIRSNLPLWRQLTHSQYYHTAISMSPDEAVAHIAAGWAKRGEDARNRGTLFHKSAEEHIKGGQENAQVKEFIERKQLKPVASEFVVFAPELGVAGTIDALFEDSDGKLVLLDWKTSKDIDDRTHGKKGIGVAESYDDSKVHRYSLQLALYAALLKRCCGVNVGRRIIAGVQHDHLITSIPAVVEEADAVAQALLDQWAEEKSSTEEDPQVPMSSRWLNGA